jgi:anti-anti-sigma factor
LTLCGSARLLVVHLAGDLDKGDVVACFRSVLDRCRQLGATTVRFEMADVSFLSASALGALAAAHADLAAEGCDLELSGCSGVVRRLVGLADAVGMLPEGLWPARPRTATG